MNQRKRKFVKAYVDCLDVKQAALEAGYADNRSIMKRGRDLRKELHGPISQAFKERWQGLEAEIRQLEKLEDLSVNSDSEQVKLNATRELLDYARPAEAQQIEVTHTHEHKQLSNAELDARIALLREKLWEDAPRLEVVEDE